MENRQNGTYRSIEMFNPLAESFKVVCLQNVRECAIEKLRSIIIIV